MNKLYFFLIFFCASLVSCGFSNNIAVGSSLEEQSAAESAFGKEDNLSQGCREVHFAGKQFLAYKTTPSSVKMALKDSAGIFYRTIKALADDLKKQKKEIAFAMNGGMYVETGAPCGLYIENGKRIQNVNRNFSGAGNFCLSFGKIKTNGIFLIKKDNKAQVVRTIDYQSDSSVVFATQSGPLLVFNDTINSVFGDKSTNLNIRNGVGVDSKGNVVFVKSISETNFYDMAKLFRDTLKCSNALYLDGVVSDIYCKGYESFSYTPLGVLIYTLIE
ncbi:MAG: phosphodiester glycosidase family protein [Bacteroidales bacterium]|nr:phosphodiester glycosidase family protein [Bacteroidales bacterium]